MEMQKGAQKRNRSQVSQKNKKTKLMQGIWLRPNKDSNSNAQFPAEELRIMGVGGGGFIVLE